MDLRSALARSAASKRPGATFVMREPAFQQLREALAHGLHAGGLAVEAASKALTPVHGDPSQGGPFATYAPGAKPIGGTLRRSQHTATYVDGRKLLGMAVDENRARVPDHDPAGSIATVVGTNVEYAVHVHDGTTRMVGRPFLTRAMVETAPELPAIIAAGTRRHLGQQGPDRPTSGGRARDARGRFTSTRQ